MAPKLSRDKARGFYSNDRHRGSRRRYLPRDKFKQLPYGRVYKQQSFLETGRKWTQGQSFLPAQPTRPRNQQELPDHRGHRSDVKTLLNIIIKDLHPLSIVKGSYLTRSLQPSFDAQLTASWFRTELQNIYRHKRVEVQNEIDNTNNLVLSAELWSSNEKQSYLTVSCHLINRNWELKSYTLDTAHLLTKTTAENAVEHLLRISNEWNLTGKAQFVVTNMESMRKAQNNVCGWNFMSCFAFTLDKVFRETITVSDLEPLLRKCQQIVAFFHQSNTASQTLQEYCESLHLQRSELTQSASLKWLPTLYMMKNILGQWRAIFEVFIARRVEDLGLNENERKIVEQIVAVLEILKDVTQDLGKRGFSSISKIIPLVQKLQDRLRNLGMENRIANQLSKKCDYHIGNIKKNRWFRVCTALDPRYKTSMLRDSDMDDIKEEIRRQMRAETHGGLDSESQASVLQKYWEITSISANTLEFWKTKEEEFGKLSMVARKYLTLVSTAVPMERVHQLTEAQIIDRRSCLEPENLNMILFLNSNQ